MLFAIELNQSFLGFRYNKMIKKKIEREKGLMCEVINTQSGHQIRASVKIFLVLRDPDCFFFSFFSHQNLVSLCKICLCLSGGFLICINFYDLSVLH